MHWPSSPSQMLVRWEEELTSNAERRPADILRAFRSSPWMRIVANLAADFRRAQTEGVADDVYQAALRVAASGRWNVWKHESADGIAPEPAAGEAVVYELPAPDPGTASDALPEEGTFFRGQRDHRWPIIPAISRPTDGDDLTLPTQAVESRTRRLGETLSRLGSAFPGYPAASILGIAQHYSDISGAATWMLDVSTDPFVGLFFASLGGKAGDTGVLYRFHAREMARVGLGAHSSLGRLRVATAPGVQRLAQQRGLFIEAPRLDVMNLYAPFVESFFQHEGVVFEDALRGITRGRLLGVQPDIVQVLDPARGVSNGHPGPPRPSRLGQCWIGEEFCEHITAVYSERGEEVSRYGPQLAKLGEFHAYLANHGRSMDVRVRSLRRLFAAASAIFKRAPGDEGWGEQVLEVYSNQVGDVAGADGLLARAARHVQLLR